MRQDIHRPSAIIPEDYDFVAFEHQKIEGFGDCAAVLANREIIRNHMARTGGNYSGHDHGGNCGVCGAWAIYTILFHHAKTNTYIRTGMDCANKMDMSYGDMNAFRKTINDYRQAKAGVHKAELFLLDRGLGRAWEIRGEGIRHRAEAQAWFDQHPDGPAFPWSSKFNQDFLKIDEMVGKLIRYGSLSGKQVDFLRVLVNRFDSFEQRQAKFAAERELAQPCPTGRVKVTGEVVKVAPYDSQFGTTMKMTVKSLEGFLVFATVPAAMPVPNRGDTVSFVATLTPSDRDPKFGFGKRLVAA